MPFRRRLLTWVVLTLVVVVGAGFGGPAEAAEVADHAAGTPRPAEVAGDHGHHGDQGGPGEHTEHSGEPCVVRPECGGVWTLGIAGLLLAVVVTVPAVGVVPTVRRIVAAPTVLHSALLPSGLFRPPQTS